MTYDYAHLNDSVYRLQYTAYGALIDGTSVCQGYAVLFYRMALQSGVDARVITGLGNGGPHAWNIVKIGRCYYNLDSTWDAGTTKYRYFLRNNQNFSDHTRDVKYADTDFNTKYPMSSDDYCEGLNVTPEKVTGVNINGRTSDALRISWNKSNTTSGYIIEQKKSGSWTRIAKINDAAAVTYRVNALSAYTNYEFRIQSFYIDEAKTVFSEWTYISGKTKPSNVTGVKIGGTAVNALRINWTKNTASDGYIIEQKKSGKWTRIIKLDGNGTTTYRVEKLQANTVYEFRVQTFGFDDQNTLYSDWSYISGRTNANNSVKDMTGVLIGGRTSDALRINWTKNTTASGYIVEQKKSGTWNRISKIEGNSNTTYRVNNLNGSTTYEFRVKGYNFAGNTAIFSNWAYVSAKTKPSNITGVKIAGKTKDALRINWTKNTTVSGYIIEQKKSGKWTRIAKIDGNSTTTYRVEKLSADTTYDFRIQGFNFDDKLALYSDWTMISGKTSAAENTVDEMKSVSISGRTADALRIKWAKNTTVSGYIIEQKKNGIWTRITKIDGNSNVSYRVDKLLASNTYSFRIQGFKFVGNTTVYSKWTYISGKTLPSTVSGFKIAGVTKDALRVSWNKNASASGYIIEQYKAGTWSRIAKIEGNSTTSYRVERLQPGTGYVFRIYAFNFDGSMPLYSTTVITAGTTNYNEISTKGNQIITRYAS